MRIDDKDYHGSIAGKGLQLFALLHRVQAFATAGRIQSSSIVVIEAYPSSKAGDIFLSNSSCYFTALT